MIGGEGTEKEKKETKKKEKIPHMYESISHRPLRAAAQKSKIKKIPVAKNFPLREGAKDRKKNRISANKEFLPRA